MPSNDFSFRYINLFFLSVRYTIKKERLSNETNVQTFSLSLSFTDNRICISRQTCGNETNLFYSFMYRITSSEQSPLFTCKAHIFQVDPETRKSWLPLSIGAGRRHTTWRKITLFYFAFLVNVQIFHDSVKNVYRIVSVDGSKILLNTIISARMTFTKTSQKFCQWVDSRANRIYGLGFANENELTRVDQRSSIEEFHRLLSSHLVYGKISRS